MPIFDHATKHKPKKKIMRALALIIGIIITSSTYGQVKGITKPNKYLFYMTGVEFDAWNKSIKTDEYLYLIRPSIGFDKFYREMHIVLDANDFDFDSPGLDESKDDIITGVTIEDMMDERVPFRSNAIIDRYYSNDDITIYVHISETLCFMEIYSTDSQQK